MWGVMWGAPTILKVALPGFARHVRDTNLRERPAARSSGQRSDVSRGPAFSWNSSKMGQQEK
jgi:hypothetical protein